MTEEQKIQELLKPRYKVIADYPGNVVYNIGRIVDAEGFEPNFDKYPHLFRKLEWWEERDASEMPEYVKPKRPEEYRKQFGEVVLQVDKRTSGLHQFHATNLFQLASMRWSEWLPATEADYNEYLQTLTHNQEP